MTLLSPHRHRINTLILVFAVLTAFWLNLRNASPDLLATWLAGAFLNAGDLGHVYPADAEVFTMYPPDGWRAFMAEHSYHGPVFPFLYPPLWAWVGALLPDYESYRVFKLIMTLVNPALLAFSIILARRAAAPTADPILFTLLALGFLAGTNVGHVALLQNQPQIFVSFLLILTMERLHSGRETHAGAALALAAAIKLYPVFFLPLLLVCGHRRAGATFVVIGVGMAAVSVFLTGRPLHIAFLHAISQISATTLISGASWNFDAMIAQAFFAADMTLKPALELQGTTAAERGWYILAKPPLWSVLSKTALLGAVVFVTWLGMRRKNTANLYTAVWPLALLLVSLFGPLTWNYSFLPLFVLLPARILQLPTRGAIAVFALCFLPISPLMAAFWHRLDFVAFPNQLFAVVTLGIVAVTLATGLGRQKTPSIPGRPI